MLARDEQVIKRLQEKHGINEDQASRLFVRLRRGLALDIIDADSGMPVALCDDYETSRIGDEMSGPVVSVSEHD